MALENLGSRTWYKSKKGSLSEDDKEERTIIELGKGKANTDKMIKMWKEDTDTAKETNDVWNVIQNAGIDLDKWYVPSRAEWAAFVEFCYTKLEPKMDTSNYSSRGLKYWYWSSSQMSTSNAWIVNFNEGYINGSNISSSHYIRLGATF